MQFINTTNNLWPTILQSNFLKQGTFVIIEYIEKFRWISIEQLFRDFLLFFYIFIWLVSSTIYTGNIIFALHVLMQLLYWKLARKFINIFISIDKIVVKYDYAELIHIWHTNTTE